MSPFGSRKTRYCLPNIVSGLFFRSSKISIPTFLAQLRIEITLTIQYFRKQAAFGSWGVKASNLIYRMAGHLLAAFCRPENGEFTILSGNPRLIIASLLLSMLSPLAALAYSYDELVQMVQAEEKAFGKANFDLSLDQRLNTLEKSVIGYTQSGSDSFRLRAICKKLGMEKSEGPSIAAPYSVDIVPVANDQNTTDDNKIADASTGKLDLPAKPAKKQAAKGNGNQKNEEAASNAEESAKSAENTFSSILNTNTESTEPIKRIESSESSTESDKNIAPASKEIPVEQKSDLSNARKIDSAAKLPVLSLPVPKLDLKPATASSPVSEPLGNSAGSINSAAQSNDPGNNSSAGIFAAIFGFIAIVLGAGLFLFIRNNKEEQIPFGHRRINLDSSQPTYDVYDGDEESDHLDNLDESNEKVGHTQTQKRETKEYGQEIFYIDRSFSKKVGRQFQQVNNVELDFQPQIAQSNETAQSSQQLEFAPEAEFVQIQASEWQSLEANCIPQEAAYVLSQDYIHSEHSEHSEPYVPSDNQITLRFSTQFEMEESGHLTESQSPREDASLFVFGQDFASDLPFNLEDSVYLNGNDNGFVNKQESLFSQNNFENEAAEPIIVQSTQKQSAVNAAFISECQNVEKQILNESQNAHIPEEFTSILDLMSAEQLDRLLDEFIPSTLAMDTAQEFNILTASSGEDELPPLLGVNVSDFWSEEPQPSMVEVDDYTSVPVEWPAFEPPVAPRIFSVSTFVKEALKDATELIGCSSDPAQRELEMLLTTDCLERKEEWGGESYRALAQLLIDAANQATCPQAQPVAAGVPLSGKRMMVAHLTGRKMSAEYENSLRQLFSEKC